MEEKYATHIQLVESAIKAEGHKVIDHAIVGSTYIRDDKVDPKLTDLDILVLVAPGTSVDEMFFEEEGRWQYGGSVGEGGEGHWGSFKRYMLGREVNMLITSKPEYFAAWITAAEVCRFLAKRGVSVDKEVVRSIHNIVMDGSDADEEVGRFTGVTLWCVHPSYSTSEAYAWCRDWGYRQYVEHKRATGDASRILTENGYKLFGEMLQSEMEDDFANQP